MSHVATIELEFKDPAQLKQACRDLNYRFEENATVQLYQKTARYEGCTAVHLPHWDYPVAVMPDGKLHYDNYDGGWGDIKHLNALRQRYARNVAVSKATQRGYRVVGEHTNEKGEVKLRLATR